ncbi:MAG TPA: haloacid dehalogenase, partial [Bacillota bacterium]|nr:haloacid dehalogenase [Bacillota bacterium]
MKNHNGYAFLFDMDGTLVDNMNVHNQVWIDYIRELGGNPDPETFNDMTAGKRNLEILRLYLNGNIPEETLLTYADEKEKRYR